MLDLVQPFAVGEQRSLPGDVARDTDDADHRALCVVQRALRREEDVHAVGLAQRLFEHDLRTGRHDRGLVTANARRELVVDELVDRPPDHRYVRITTGERRGAGAVGEDVPAFAVLGEDRVARRVDRRLHEHARVGERPFALRVAAAARQPPRPQPGCECEAGGQRDDERDERAFRFVPQRPPVRDQLGRDLAAQARLLGPERVEPGLADPARDQPPRRLGIAAPDLADDVGRVLLPVPERGIGRVDPSGDRGRQRLRPQRGEGFADQPPPGVVRPEERRLRGERVPAQSRFLVERAGQQGVDGLRSRVVAPLLLVERPDRRHECGSHRDRHTEQDDHVSDQHDRRPARRSGPALPRHARGGSQERKFTERGFLHFLRRTEAAEPPFFEAAAVEPDHLRIEITTEPDCARVTLRGELDLGSVPEFEIETAPLHEGPGAPSKVLLDLGELTFCDSAGLRALLVVTRALERRDAGVRLVNVPPSIRRVIEITGTATIFHIDQD